MFIKFMHKDTPDSAYDIVEVDGFEKMSPEPDSRDIYLRLSKHGHEYGGPRLVTCTAYIMNNEGKTIERIDKFLGKIGGAQAI